MRKLEESRIIFSDGSQIVNLLREGGTLAFYSKDRPNTDFFKGKLDDVTVISGDLSFEEWYPHMALVDKIEETENGYKFVLMAILGEVAEITLSGENISLIR